MHPSKTAIAAGLAVCAYLGAGNAAAEILVNIGDGGDRTWNQAIVDGNVVEGVGLTWAADQFYSQTTSGGTQGDDFGAATPILTSDVPFNGEQSLVMSWQPAAPQPDSFLWIASWDYVFDNAQPVALWGNSKSTMIHFSLWPPTGVWDVSLELIDDQGRSRGWFFPDPAGSGLADVWSVWWIDVELGPQGVFSEYYSEPGFDLGRVVAIRLNESGMESGPFPADPTGNGIFWNAWDHLIVKVPEPPTLALFALALAGIGTFRRRTAKV